MFEAFSLLGLTALGAFIVLSLTYFIAEKIQNAGIVDVVWSFSFSTILASWAFTSYLQGNTVSTAFLILLIMVILHSGRLGTYIFRRTVGHLAQEDSRYASLRKAWPKWGFFLMFQMQGLLILILTSPFLSALPIQHFILSIGLAAGLFIFGLGLIGETVADRQLEIFKRNNQQPGALLNTGLWRVSRHPNYFFHWLSWLGISICGISLTGNFWFSVQPLLMWFILTKMSGVRFTEELMLEKRGEAYRQYQQQTPAFSPSLSKLFSRSRSTP